MNRYFISLLVLTICTSLSYAQGTSSDTTGSVTTVLPKAPIQISTVSVTAPKAPPQAVSGTVTPLVVAKESKDSLALAELDNKESAEVQVLEEKISAIRKKFADDLQSAQDQISAVREKYRTDRYALMDRVSPGSGTSMAKRDKGIADLDAQFRKDMDALNAKQGAEAAAGTMTKESQAKFQADRKALMDAYAAKKQELFSLPSATTGK